MSNGYILAKRIENNDFENPDSIFNLEGVSERTLNALYRANVTTIKTVNSMTDIDLLRIRNFGSKCLDEIYAAIPDRASTYEGELEDIAIRRTINRVDSEARKVLRFMESKNKTLSEILATYKRLTRGDARQFLVEYCLFFPERIDEVLSLFEAVQDTSDAVYKKIKAAAANRDLHLV